MAGWLDKSQIVFVTSNWSGWIEQKEMPSSGVKLVKIPRGPNQFFVLDLTTGLGFDSQNSAHVDNVTLRWVTEDRNNMLLPNFGEAIYYLYDEIFHPGQPYSYFDKYSVFCNPELGITIEVGEIKDRGTVNEKAFVTVTVVCLDNAPVVSTWGTPQTVFVGDTLPIEYLSIYNGNPPVCGTETYSLSTKDLPQGWSFEAPKTVDGAPYGTTTVSSSVAIASDTKPGSYQFEIVATNMAKQTLSGETTVSIMVLENPNPTPTPSPSPEPTPSPIPTPKPSPTPTPPCIATNIVANPRNMKIRRRGDDEVIVSLNCADGSPSVGEMITATVKKGKKKIAVSPASQETDVNGQSQFAITAMNKTGQAKIVFETSNGLATTAKVKVK